MKTEGVISRHLGSTVYTQITGLQRFQEIAKNTKDYKMVVYIRFYEWLNPSMMKTIIRIPNSIDDVKPYFPPVYTSSVNFSEAKNKRV